MRPAAASATPVAAAARVSRHRTALLALSSPLLILLALLALLLRPASERWQAVPALLIGVGLLSTSIVLRRQRRREILRSLRRQPPDGSGSFSPGAK